MNGHERKGKLIYSSDASWCKWKYILMPYAIKIWCYLSYHVHVYVCLVVCRHYFVCPRSKNSSVNCNFLGPFQQSKKRSSNLLTLKENEDNLGDKAFNRRRFNTKWTSQIYTFTTEISILIEHFFYWVMWNIGERCFENFDTYMSAI